jgi:membrane protein implicated in regulation of membrane protease activity
MGGLYLKCCLFFCFVVKPSQLYLLWIFHLIALVACMFNRNSDSLAFDSGIFMAFIVLMIYLINKMLHVQTPKDSTKVSLHER